MWHNIFSHITVSHMTLIEYRAEAAKATPLEEYLKVLTKAQSSILSEWMFSVVSEYEAQKLILTEGLK